MEDVSTTNWEDEYEEYTEDEENTEDEEDGIDWSEVEKITPYKKEHN